MYLTEYYYQDRDLNMIAAIQAESIIAADAIMKEKKLNHFITGSGGKLVFHDANDVRTAILDRNAAGFPKDVTTVHDSKPNVAALFANSLYEALEKHREEVKRYRYNPQCIVLWVTAMGPQIVKDFDPPKFTAGKPQVPVNTFFNQ